MFLLPTLTLAPLLVLPEDAGQMNDARLLVEAQVQAAATAAAVLEKLELPPSARAGHLLPITAELARLHALRAHMDTAQLEAAEAEAAANRHVQQLALRLLRAVEHCAATGYAGSPELEAAVRRLSLAIEGELEEEAPPPAATEQNDAVSAH